MMSRESRVRVRGRVRFMSCSFCFIPSISYFANVIDKRRVIIG